MIYILKKIATILYSYFIRSQIRHCGKNFRIHFPSIINNPDRLLIGDNVTIGSGAYLNCGPRQYGSGISLKIGSHSNIGRFVHINAYKNVTIEDYVLIAERVHISDASHIYNKDPDTPIMHQGEEAKGGVIIRRGA